MDWLLWKRLSWKPPYLPISSPPSSPSPTCPNSTMGGQLSLITPSATTVSIEAYILELGDIQYERNLGDTRFLKTILGSCRGGLFTVKVFIKPNNEMDISTYLKRPIYERSRLSNVANAVAYDRIHETDQAAYLVRQYFKANLYDRISTRPFLEHVEKTWISYQLLKGLETCHEMNIFHGDIKTENIMVTSWNWAYLADFASFKPVFLPEDDPSQFTFFFDTSQRRSCYVAPERFLSTGEQQLDAGLTAAMDIFSLGCVIAELFLEGSSIFSLSQLFKYKKGEYTPSLNGIDDVNTRELISSMISLDPNQRLSASEYLDKYADKVFPEYFDFLHSYIHEITQHDMNGVIHGSDDRILRIWDDYSTISGHLKFEYPEQPDIDRRNGHNIPVILDLPGMNHWIPSIRKSLPDNTDGSLMLLHVITSALRSCHRSETKVRAADLILALGERVYDEAKLDRCLPYLMGLLDDNSDHVQMSAIVVITQLLSLVGTITALQENIFSEYILPRFLLLLSRSSALVRATYAGCLPTLAQTASRFLDMGQVLKAAGFTEEIDIETENGDDQYAYSNTAFDSLRLELMRDIETQARMILDDSDREVKRALLRSVGPLCFFFGRQKTNDVILSHGITFLNDRDPFLRMELFDSVVGIAPYIGTVGLTEYVLPLMKQTLIDPEEFVVERVIRSFSSFCDMGLIPLTSIWELLELTAKFIIHPNSWIRISCLGLFSSATRWMSVAQINCKLLPLLRPFLECDIVDFSEANLLQNAKDPLPRPIYNLTVTWATKAQKSLFWKQSQRDQRSSQYDQTKAKNSSYRSKSKINNALSSEDKLWLNRLAEVGLRENQLWMIDCYKSYIYSVASLKSSLNKTASLDEIPSFIAMQKLGAMPQTIFLDYSASEHRQNETNGTEELIEDDISYVNTKESISGAITSRKESISRVISSTSMTTETVGTNNRTRDANGSNNRTADTVELAKKTADALAPTNKTADAIVGLNNKVVHAEMTSHEHSSEISQTKRFSSYNGDNPYVWKLLQNVYNDPKSRQPMAFGPKVELFVDTEGSTTSSVVRKRRIKPRGLLMASFEEHQDAINCIAVSSDEYFFVTGSEDGTIKVWDTSRLEKNVINVSVQTFDCGSAVQKLCFIDATYTIACSTADSSIKMIKVEFNKQNRQYRRLRQLYQFSLSSEGSDVDGSTVPSVPESAVSLVHVSTHSSSILYIATTNNRIYAYDFGTMSIKRKLQNPETHGAITCMVADRQSNWILIGTSRGILDLWDIRFDVLVRSWSISGGNGPISDMCLHPKHKKQVCIAGGMAKYNDTSVWDVETMECKEVYREGNSTDMTNLYTAVDVNEDMSMESLKLDDLNDILPSMTCITAGTDFDQIPQFSTASRHGYLVTGGQDRIVRFWDMHNAENSTAVCGTHSGTEKTVHSVSQTGIKLVTENIVSTNKNKSKNERPSRAAIISAEQADLGRNHHCTITAVAITRRPYDLIISGDRSGSLKVHM